MKRDELEEAFVKYAPMILRRATSLLRQPEEAKDVMQDVFIRAMTERGGFEGRSEVSTWLYRITTNLCLNRLRDGSRRRELEALHLTPPDAPLDPGNPEQRILVQRLLAEADPSWSEAAVYVLIDGMSHDEAAALLGVSRRTVGNLLARFEEWARARLKTHLTSDQLVPIEREGAA